MFEIAFIQERGNGRLMPESALVRDHCLRINLPFELYTPKRIQRRQLPLTPRSFVFGDMDAMHGAMRQLGIPVPDAVYYPASLHAFLRRKVWLDTLGNVRHRVNNAGQPVFAKPAGRAKIFTGQVFSDHSDFYFVGETSGREPVWCSDVVRWQSEYRVYVNSQDIVSVDHYSGDAAVQLDISVIQAAVNEYTKSGEAPAAYGIDFGVLVSGETALVEANDGFALGAYAINSAAYTEMMFRRWRQLLDTATEV